MYQQFLEIFRTKNIPDEISLLILYHYNGLKSPISILINNSINELKNKYLSYILIFRNENYLIKRWHYHTLNNSNYKKIKQHKLLTNINRYPINCIVENNKDLL